MPITVILLSETAQDAFFMNASDFFQLFLRLPVVECAIQWGNKRLQRCCVRTTEGTSPSTQRHCRKWPGLPSGNKQRARYQTNAFNV